MLNIEPEEVACKCSINELKSKEVKSHYVRKHWVFYMGSTDKKIHTHGQQIQHLQL